MKSCELLIAGAGAAGLSAAAAARAAGCGDILLLDRAGTPGGILLQCTHEGFGLAAFGRELRGPEYAARLAGALSESGLRFLPGQTLVRVTPERTAFISGRGSFSELSFRHLILAVGARERTLGTLPLGGTRPAGIFTAGQAQELINLRRWDFGDEIVILGSGDLGMIMAGHFARAGKHVAAVLEQNRSYGGLARNYHRCIEAFGLPLRCRMTVRAIHGAGRICGVTAENLDTGAREYLPCDTLVTALGLLPEREAVRGLGQPEWLSLAGNCRRIHDLADTAAADGARAGQEAAQLLNREFP